MRYHSYLNTAKRIIESNNGEMPFAVFLKKYFAPNKKYGSKDRKQIAGLCYNFYRLGKVMPGDDIADRIIAAVFLCEQSSSEFLNFHKPEWNDIITKPLDEKTAFIGFDIEKIFPWPDQLSDGIDMQQFNTSFFVQPDLFLRIRPGKKNAVIKKLQASGFAFEMPAADCIALPNTSKLDALFEIDKELVVQDYNSQKVLDVLKKEDLFNEPVISVWDCCAASGGKSILAYDLLRGKIQLTVSDIRESILSNLKKRFAAAGIKHYQSLVTDLSSADCKLPTGNLPTGQAGCQLIICDTPCTGSGTWSRTPEQLFFFKEKMITAYAAKQQQIVSNIIPHLQAGGVFIYITCSVFKKENEEMVNYVKEKFHLRLLQMELLKGYDKKADSMFVAVFIKK